MSFCCKAATAAQSDLKYDFNFSPFCAAGLRVCVVLFLFKKVVILFLCLSTKVCVKLYNSDD